MDKGLKNLLGIAAAAIVVALLVWMLGGCKTARMRHEDRVVERAMKHDTTVVRVDSVHSDTVLVPGEPVFVNCDSIVRATPLKDRAAASHVAVMGGSPLTTFVFDTVYQTRDRVVENMIHVRLLEDSVKRVQHRNDVLSGKMRGRVNSGWRLACVILAVLLLLFFWIKRK